MKADMRSKKFGTNVYREPQVNILKVAGIYGANNTGKTCLIKCIEAIKSIMANGEPKLRSNMFIKSSICELGVTFLFEGEVYSYDCKYDVEKREYSYEKFVKILKDQYGNEKEEVWLIKNIEEQSYYSKDKNIEEMIPLFSHNKPLCYSADTRWFENLAVMKRIIITFSSQIDIVNMNNIPMQKTIDLMKNKDDLQKKVVDFIKNADLYMDNFEYVEGDRIAIKPGDENEKAEEKALDIPELQLEHMRLVSTYKGVHVPSMIFDSTGTKKISALAGYIIKALEQGRILIVDELDSSIHFKLTRAIVAMFNNELNFNAQLIFTVHDINLMDCKRLFRKEQIWFVHKDDSGVYLYSLGDFTAAQGVRDTTDVIEKYRKGILGALPEPELINTLLEINGNKREEEDGEQ
jgi:AAA15 family ATPase/GTPase